jgi:hypothetical protein
MYFILNGVNAYVTSFEGVDEWYKGLEEVRKGREYISPVVPNSSAASTSHSSSATIAISLCFYPSCSLLLFPGTCSASCLVPLCEPDSLQLVSVVRQEGEGEPNLSGGISSEMMLISGLVKGDEAAALVSADSHKFFSLLISEIGRPCKMINYI